MFFSEKIFGILFSMIYKVIGDTPGNHKNRAGIHCLSD
jgi:hypothetical protein